MKTKDLLQLLTDNDNKIEIGKLELSIGSGGDLDMRFNNNLLGWTSSHVLPTKEETKELFTNICTDTFADPEIKEKHTSALAEKDLEIDNLKLEMATLKRELALKESLGDAMKIKDGMIQAYERILMRTMTLG